MTNMSIISVAESTKVVIRLLPFVQLGITLVITVFGSRPNGKDQEEIERELYRSSSAPSLNGKDAFSTGVANRYR